MRSIEFITENKQSKDWFSPEAYNMVSKSPKAREMLIMMPIKMFLQLAEKGYDADKMKRCQQVVDSNGQFDGLPFLSFEHDGEGKAWVYDHEGRHRARALYEIGIRDIPVIMRSVGGKGGEIRFGSQRPGTFDWREVWPTTLRNQDDTMTLPFPILRDEETGHTYEAGSEIGVTSHLNENHDAVMSKDGREIKYNYPGTLGRQWVAFNKTPTSWVPKHEEAEPYIDMFLKKIKAPNTISEFSDYLEEKYNLSSLHLFYTSIGNIELGTIIVEPNSRKQGIGSAVMQEICDYADKHSSIIQLSPAIRDPHNGTTSRPRLVKFYKRFGFVENKGRKKNYELSGSMYRLPNN